MPTSSECRERANFYISKSESQSQLADASNGVWCSAYATMALFWQREGDRLETEEWMTRAPNR